MGSRRLAAVAGKRRGIARQEAESSIKSIAELTLPQELAATFSAAENIAEILNSSDMGLTHSDTRKRISTRDQENASAITVAMN
jgi:hypothetical protein